MPGLINGHTHIPMSALRGYSDDKNLMDWLTKDIFPIEAHLTPEIIRTASEFSCAEMMRTGTTAFYDMYMHERSVFQAADRMGMRAVMGESMTHFFPGLSAASEQELRDLILALAEEWKGHPRIKGAIVPHAIYTTGPDFLQRCRALADELGWQFGMHLSETSGETERCLKQHCQRPVEYCRSLGILRPDTTLFHMVDTDGEDLDTIAEAGCAIVHNPASNMKLTSGAAPIGSMLSRGIPVGLGTDGPASNNSQNMVREMYLCSLLQKLDTMDPTALPAQTALDMATWAAPAPSTGKASAPSNPAASPTSSPSDSTNPTCSPSTTSSRTSSMQPQDSKTASPSSMAASSTAKAATSPATTKP